MIDSCTVIRFCKYLNFTSNHKCSKRNICTTKCISTKFLYMQFQSVHGKRDVLEKQFRNHTYIFSNHKISKFCSIKRTIKICNCRSLHFISELGCCCKQCYTIDFIFSKLFIIMVYCCRIW